MELTREDKEMLEGKMGKDIQYAMEILVKLGEAFDAKRMINCDGAHLYSPALYAFAFSDDEVNANLEHVKKERIKVRTLATCCACVPDMEAPRQIEGFDRWTSAIAGIEKPATGITTFEIAVFFRHSRWLARH